MNRTLRWLSLTLLAALIMIAAPAVYAGEETPPPHVHNWSAWVADPSAPASCTAGGRLMRTCSAAGCPAPAEFQNTPALGHDWGAWTPYQTATCTQTGTLRSVCARCGQAQFQSTPALGHDWVHHKTDATCTGVGVEEDVCSRCGVKKNTIVTAALGHDWGLFTETKAAACTLPGQEETTCTRCGQKWTRAIPALGHDWGSYQTKQEADCTHPGIEMRVCSRCTADQTRVYPALGHNWGPYEVVTPATCTATGLSASTCARCLIQRTRVLSKIDHSYGAWSVAVAPACTTRGTELRECSMCGRQQTRQLKALGHSSDGVWITVRQPSLSERGLQATTCTVCGERAKTRTFAPRGYRYDIETHAFGPRAAQVHPSLAALSERLIPIDMRAEGQQRFPLVTEDGYEIGAALITVSGGSLRVSLEKASEPTLLRFRTLHVYQSPEDALRYRAEGDSLPFDQAVKAEGERVLVSITITANYYQGNENKTFHEGMMSPDGVNSYADLAAQMASDIAAHWAVQ